MSTPPICHMASCAHPAEIDLTDPVAAELHWRTLVEMADSLLAQIIATGHDACLESCPAWIAGSMLMQADDPAERLHGAALQIAALQTVPDAVLASVRLLHTELQALTDGG